MACCPGILWVFGLMVVKNSKGVVNGGLKILSFHIISFLN